MKRILPSVLCLLLVFALASCGGTEQHTPSTPSESTQVPSQTITAPADGASPGIAPPEEFVLISGGTFQMGSPESEAWRVEDETAHTVTVSDYYISKFEVTQAEYQAIMGENPSAFTGDDFPVESISWIDELGLKNRKGVLTMANKLDRIEKDIQKVKSKIAEYNKQLRELEGQKTEQENLQIIQLVRGMNMTREEFAAFLRGGALQTAPTLTPYHEKEDTGHEE